MDGVHRSSRGFKSGPMSPNYDISFCIPLIWKQKQEKNLTWNVYLKWRSDTEGTT